MLSDFVARCWAHAPGPLRSVYYRISGNRSPFAVLLPDKTAMVKIQGGIAEGLTMRLNLRNERNYYCGLHEVETQQALKRLVKEGMTVYNVGAHIGFFALALGRLVGPRGRVVAFEPNPIAARRFQEHISLNAELGNVHLEEQAVSDSTGIATFSLSLGGMQGRFADLPHVKPGNTIEVSCVTLDSYIAEGNESPHLVLMDAEHAEGRVLRGMSAAMETSSPIVIVEMHGKESAGEAWKELRRHGYSLTDIRKLPVSSQSEVGQGQYIAVRVQ